MRARRLSARRGAGTAAGRLAVLALALAAVVLLPGCYLLKQGTYLFAYNARAVSIERALQRQELEAEIESFLRLVREVRLFAVEELGLAADKNYSRYVELEREYLVDVVAAAQPDSLTPHLWRFPLFGSFPYKGYYVRSDALREARRLERKGLDVWVRKVDAFSTLGFFSDPVYSFMAGYSPFEIANLIIHEQTHATVFVKDQVQFNEELATFVGWEGALEFLRSRFGEGSDEHRQAVDRLADWQQFNRLLLGLYEELDRAYRQAPNRDEALVAKQRLFEGFNRTVTRERFRTEAFQGFKGIPANNAYVLAAVNYFQDLELFYRLHAAAGGDLRHTIEIVKEVASRRGDPKQALREAVEELQGAVSERS